MQHSELKEDVKAVMAAEEWEKVLCMKGIKV